MYHFVFSDLDNNYLNEIRKNRTRFTKSIWVLLYTVQIGICGYLAGQLVFNYSKYETYNLDSTALAANYTFPAMTICNVNHLNYTAMRNTPISKDSEFSVYDVYKNLSNAFKDLDNDWSAYTYDALEDKDVFTEYAFDIEQAIIPELMTFGKRAITSDEFIDTGYTGLGTCLELNDNEYLVQKVNGAVGGLHMTLDLQTKHYLPETEMTGFIITFRSPNETILVQEYGFRVSPGNAYYINVKTSKVTRLAAPWGSCQDQYDHFDDQGFMTNKECALNQLLWMYPKLEDEGCGCYPWFFYSRYFEDSTDKKYDTAAKWRIMKYWTEDLPFEYNFQFNETCSYSDNMLFVSEHIQTKFGVKDWEMCGEECTNHTQCRYFMYSSDSNDVMKAQECQLFKTRAKQQSFSSSSTTGITRGDTQCLEMGRCGISDTLRCKNLAMAKLTTRELDSDDIGKSNLPPTCYEPCKYQKFDYTISSNKFPTDNYWSILKNPVHWYANIGEAQSNLVKLVFYTDEMSTTNIDETASYEISSFIAELGGLTDFFVGLSFFTAFQLVEWVLTKLLRCGKPRKNKAEIVENIELRDSPGKESKPDSSNTNNPYQSSLFGLFD